MEEKIPERRDIDDQTPIPECRKAEIDGSLISRIRGWGQPDAAPRDAKPPALPDLFRCVCGCVVQQRPDALTNFRA
jgi:hypothetical protein